jgi:hypothetical protein
MDNRDSRAKRTPKELWLYRNYTDSRYGPSAQERQILEMIVRGAPLSGTLNKLCTLIDLEIGNTVSVVSVVDDGGGHVSAHAQSATQVGLILFSSTDIFSRSKTLLGTLEIYGCDPRLLTANENQLIQRVALLAAIALQRHKDAQKLNRTSGNWDCALDRGADEKPPFIN